MFVYSVLEAKCKWQVNLLNKERCVTAHPGWSININRVASEFVAKEFIQYFYFHKIICVVYYFKIY